MLYQYDVKYKEENARNISKNTDANLRTSNQKSWKYFNLQQQRYLYKVYII